MVILNDYTVIVCIYRLAEDVKHRCVYIQRHLDEIDGLRLTFFGANADYFALMQVAFGIFERIFQIIVITIRGQRDRAFGKHIHDCLILSFRLTGDILVHIRIKTIDTIFDSVCSAPI